MQKDETKSEILIGFAWGNSGFISRRGVVCAAARRTWLDARCVLCAGQRFENHTWLWAIRKFKAANKSCMFTLCMHCSSWARAKSGVTFKYTMLAKWNLSDWGDRCPSVVNNSGRLCGVKLFGCISICSTFNASVRFSGDVAAGKRYPRQLITVLDETHVFLRQFRKICGRCTTSARKRCAIDKLPVLAWWHEG